MRALVIRNIIDTNVHRPWIVLPLLPANATVPMPEDANLAIVGNMFKGAGVGGLNMAQANLYWQRHWNSDWPADLQAAGQPNRYRAYLREMGLDGTAPSSVGAAGPETVNPPSLHAVTQRVLC